MASDNDNNFKKNNDDDSNRQGMPPNFAGKSSKAAFVWILIFIALGTMIFVQFSNKTGAQDKDQAFFEQEIAAGKVISVKLIPETDRIM